MAVSGSSWAEELLLAGDMPCPGCFSAASCGRMATAAPATVRGLGQSAIPVTPRRARCGDCGATQILLPTALITRRADTTEVIGNALVANVKGAGYRTIAASLGRPESTVRRWLRRVRGDHPEWLFWKGHEAAVTLDPTILDRATYTTRLGDALNILAGAALTYRKRYNVAESGWALIGLLAAGHLLAPPPAPAITENRSRRVLPRPQHTITVQTNSSPLPAPAPCPSPR